MGERFGFAGGGRGLEALDVDVGVLCCQGILRCLCCCQIKITIIEEEEEPY